MGRVGSGSIIEVAPGLAERRTSTVKLNAGAAAPSIPRPKRSLRLDISSIRHKFTHLKVKRRQSETLSKVIGGLTVSSRSPRSLRHRFEIESTSASTTYLEIAGAETE